MAWLLLRLCSWEPAVWLVPAQASGAGKRLLLTCPVCLPGGCAHSRDKPIAPGDFTVHTVDIFSRVL